MPRRLHRTINGTSRSSALRLGDFSVLDKVLLLEASVRRAPAVSGKLRDTLLRQITAIKEDVRVISILLTAEMPVRQQAEPLPEWIRNSRRKAPKSISDKPEEK